ncbi:MAG: tetratricopeptide repeat protein [Byssovorax sp.]
MVKVECDGCKAPYQIDEKRIPPTGLKMRCPKCGTNLLVMKPAEPAAAADADLPAPAAKAPPKGAPPKPPPPKAPAAPPPRPAGGPPPPPKAAPKPPPPPKAAPKPSAVEDELSASDLESSWGDDIVEDDGGADLPSAAKVQPGPGGARPRPAPAPSAAAGGFGEIDLMVDLPAPVAEEEGTTDLPATAAVQPSAVAPPPVAPKRPIRSRNATTVDGFGVVDLPAITPGRSDLPAVRSAQATPQVARTQLSAGFGEVDLPSFDEPALPSPVSDPHPGRGGATFGEIDLPAVGDEIGLPISKPGMRGREPSFGEIDLPLVSGDSALPTPVSGEGLPVVGGYGLPVPAVGVGLPAPSAVGLPAPAPTGLPMPAPVGLPVPSGSGLPSPAMATGLPMTSGSGLPVAATATGFPMTQGGDAFSHEADLFGESDAPPVAHGRSRGMDVGDEIPLGGEVGRSNAFDDSDRAVPMQSVGIEASGIGLDTSAMELDRGPVGGEADIGSVPEPQVGDLAAAPGQGERPRRASAEEAPVKKGNARKIALAAAAALVLGGGALVLEPSIGPFGINFFLDQINAKTYAAGLDQLRTQVQADLDEDTSAAAARALAKARSVHATVPRFRPTAAYVAYVALQSGIRFGHRTDNETLAKQLLAAASTGDPSDTLKLAIAAQDAYNGQLDKARSEVAALVQQNPADIDAGSLAGEIELAAKAPDKAVAAWKAASAALGGRKSARVAFGLARASLAAGDNAAAVAASKEAVAASPQHIGARILLATALWQNVDREAEAIEALKKVTEDPAVRPSASDAEAVEAYTLLGRIHLARSRISAAEQSFAAALKLDPQAVQALIGNGELFYRSGRYSEALARFEAANRSDGDNIPARVGTAKTWIALERQKEAKDALKKLREKSPKEPLVIYWLGRAEEALGNKKEAETAYSDAISTGGNQAAVVDAYVALAHLLSGAGRNDDAAAQLAEASKKFPDLPALHKARGEVALQMGRYEEAKNEFSAALEKEDDLSTRFKLGGALRRMRAFEEAAAVLDKVAAIDKDFPGLALERGLLFEETGQSDRALEAYSEALSKAPNNVDLKLRVGSTQVIAGHPEPAEPILREVVKERPNSAEANHFLGRALLARGTNLSEAMRFLEAAVNIDPNRAEYHLYVGWAANDAGNSGRAEVELKKALELDHSLGDAYWQRGVLLQKKGESISALNDLQTAIEKRPSRFEAYATMALCFQDLLKWPEAEGAWRKAIAANGSVAEWHYRLAKILSSHGNAAGAGPELEQAVTLGEAERSKPAWLADAHFLLGEALRGSNKEKAIAHYRAFLELVPPEHPYVVDAKKALVGLGAEKPSPP